LLTIEQELEFGVFNLDNSAEGLFNYFGLRKGTKILTEFFNFVDEFKDHGCQDSFRIRIISDCIQKYDNRKLYRELVTCCGSCDRAVELDFLHDTILEFGCNFGH